ncbi:MAG: hypothetical protein K6F14_07995 [Clostridiales bacterium]|nr:hypothetical protein [Clostridiales bacterium]
MKKRVFIVILATTMLLGVIIPATFAWLNDSSLIPVGMNSYVHKSYFESGDGTGDAHYSGMGSETGCAYEIKYAVQLYYFAWLQYLGYFNQPIYDENNMSTNQIDQVYFWVSEDLDMSGWVLPPIGTSEYPFVGNFDGNGHTITNLTIQNVKDSSSSLTLSDIPVNDISNAEIIGFFGVIGSLNNSGTVNGAEDNNNGEFIATAGYLYNSQINEVKDFSINAITINTETSDSLIGALAGYVNGTVSGVAIANTSLVVKSGTGTLTNQSNISDYALVGYCTEPYKYNLNVSKVTATMPVQTNNVMYKRSQGEGAEWGGSIDMRSMHTRLQEILTAAKSYTPQTYVDEETIEIDEVTGTKRTISSHDATYGTVTDNSSTDSGTIEYYYNIESGSYVFSDFSDSTDKYDLFHGKSVSFFPKTVTTIIKESDGNGNYLIKTGFKISNGTYYLNMNNGTVSRGTDGDAATIWVYENGMICTYTENGQYYLTGTNTLSITEDNSTTWYWDSTSNDFYYDYNNVRYYLIYNNGWTVTKAYNGYVIGDGKGNYLRVVVNGNNVTLTNTTDSSQASHWTFSNDVVNPYGTVTTTIRVGNNDRTYYLRCNNGSLVLYNGNQTGDSYRTPWSNNGTSLYYSTGNSTYYLRYNGSTWETTTSTYGYTIHNEDSFLNITGISNGSAILGIGTSVADNNTDGGHTIWTFSTTGNNPSGTISALVNGTRYYLRNNNGSLTATTSNGTSWSNNGTGLYNSNNYLTLDYGTWKLTQYPRYYIYSGSNYLNITGIDGNNVTLGTGTSIAQDSANGRTLWTFSTTGNNPSGSISAVVNGTTYYLIDNNGSLSASASNSTSWSNDGSSIYVGNDYLQYNNGWSIKTIRNAIYSGSNYLNIISVTNTTATLGTSDSIADDTEYNHTMWEIGDNGYIFAKCNGTIYYLRNNSGSLTATTSNPTSWTISGSSIYTGNVNTGYYLSYDSGWVLTQRKVGYTIKYSNNYLNLTSTDTSTNNPIGTGTNRADWSDGGHTVWTFENTGTYPSGRMSVTINGTRYYLYGYNDNSVRISDNPNVGYVSWQNNSGKLSTRSRYLRYNSGWLFGSGWQFSTTNSNNKLTYTAVYGDAPSVTIARGSNPIISTNSNSTPVASVHLETDPSKAIGIETTRTTIYQTSSSIQVITRIVTTEAGGHDTYFPLTVIGGSGSDKWNADERNTGYIVGGSHASYQQASGDVRVSSHYQFTTTTSQGNQYYLQTSVNGGTYYSNRLEVLTRTYASNGFKRISDSHNSNNNSVNSDISSITKVSVSDLKLEKYETARNQLDEMLLNGASSTTGSIYGMHFMDSIISVDNLIIADKVVINGKTYPKYQMPEDCIDFRLKSAGFINFFAGTYYLNTDHENNCFFSLNHIIRDENTLEIIEIKRIKDIYGNPSNKGSGYVYVYGDGTTSGSLYGLTKMFDTDWIERPDNFKEKAMYYFEIPVNAGEYALGSVTTQQGESARYGAYLCYLDIGTSGSTEDKDRVTIAERFTIENANNVRIPKGVQLVANGQSFDTEDIYETVTVRLSNEYNGTYVLSRTGDVFNYIAQDYATMTYLGGSLLAQSTSGSGQGAITVNYHPEGGYQIKTVENITDTGLTTGVVDYLRVETVDQYNETGVRLSRTVTVFADPDLSNNTKDTLAEVGSFTYTCSNYDTIVVRCVRSASQVGFNVMFNNDVIITSVSLNGSYYFNFGDNLKNILDTVSQSSNSMTLPISGINMSSRPANDKEYLYNPSSIGDDLVSYYYYYDGNATLTPETSYTITLGETIGTQTVNNYAITLSASSGDVVVYAQQLATGCTGTIYKLNNAETAIEAIALSVTVSPAVQVNGTQLSQDSITKIVTQSQ